ncbi:HYR domain-containing protein, partial [Aestuariivivens marinum]|uniref:HYR domain-containing protein n=1 Tax=Aestuariivivens marinum TaxID=2913555 RepID=UPI001F5A8106
DVNSFDCGNIGPNTVTLTVTDNNNNVSTCTATVTVEDNVDPTITCPSDVTVACTPNGAVPSGTGVATATDNCTAANDIIIDYSDLIVPGVGNNAQVTRTWTATDASGNNSSCIQIINIVDNVEPEITCPIDITVECDEDTSPANTGIATATDNCAPVGTITIDYTDVLIPGVGNNFTISRTWTATDQNDNESSCVQIITVVDTTAPDITCPTNITQSTDLGLCEATVSVPAPLTSDNCGVVTITNDFNGTSDASDVYPIGDTLVTWTATDANGNTNTCVMTITVTDDESPSISCPDDQSVSSDANCQFTVLDYTGLVTTSDNCDTDVIVTQSPVAGTMVSGTTIVTLTATDDEGNTSECAFQLIVNDTAPPVITCPSDLTIACDADSTPSSTGSATATDNCDGAPVITFVDVVAAGTGNNSVITRTWTATDANNNSSSCDQVITIEDTAPPVVTCPSDLTIACDADSTPSSTGSATATDNCDGAPVITFVDVVAA